MPTIQTSCFLQVLLCCALSMPSLAQPPRPDSSNSTAATRATIFYQSYIGVDAAIYNGFAYQPNYRNVQGSPYFPGDNLTEGTVLYEGLTYTHMRLMFNALLDQPILNDPQGQLLSLPGDKVKQFTIGDHTFLHLVSPDIPTGYYELLVSGNTSLFVHHTRKLEEKIESNELHRYITNHEAWYLGRNGHYYPVDSDHGLLTLLADKKQQLQQYQRAQHIRFKKDPETAMEKLIDYYNQLPH